MQTRKYLILSSVTNYGCEQLQIFVDSWRRHVPYSDMVLMVDRMSPETVAWLKESGVQIVPANFSLFKLADGRKGTVHHLTTRAAISLFCSWITFWKPEDDRPLRVRDAMLDLFSSRFVDYFHFLRLFGNGHSHVLMVDCRDVVFQGTPFPCEGLHGFSETETIGGSLWAQRWFRLAYGMKTWRELVSAPFLNAGSILGDTPSVLLLLENLIRECRKIQTKQGDQAIYNYIIHRKMVPATIHACGEGAIVNLHAVPLSSLRIVEEHLVDAKGCVVPVVHQYNRVPGLAEKLVAIRETRSQAVASLVS